MPVRSALLGFAFLVGISAAAFSLSGSGAVADSGSSTINVQPVVWRDPAGKTAISIQLAPGRSDTGRFVFRIYGTGTVIGTVPLHETADEDDFDTAITATFYNEDGDQPTSVQVRLSGRIDHNNPGVTVTLTTSTAQYQVLIPITGPPGSPAAAAQTALQALKAEDWATMYGLLASDVKSGYTASLFAQTMVSQAAPRVVSFSLTGSGGPRVLNGFVYYVIPYTAQLRAADGTLSTVDESIYLVLEGSAWHCMTTGPTPP